MIRLALLLTLALTGAARAEMSLADLVGNWTGSGMYYEALSKAKMKCRLSTTGDAAKVTMSGRCGSSLGANDVLLEFVRLGNGQISMRSLDKTPSIETAIKKLEGGVTGNTLLLSGRAGLDRATMQLVLNSDGSLLFTSSRKWRTGNSRSQVTLKPR